MPKCRLPFLYILFTLFTSIAYSQTVLQPGDLAVMGVSIDIGPCGAPLESDEISFVCFQNITAGTTIDITDNAWEYLGNGSNSWGDGEGTVQMTRTGGTIAAGTVITIQTINSGGTWTYKSVSPDAGWAFVYANGPSGGPLNLESGGDQIYFMQGGTWDNQGGGQNKATYFGRILFGYNTLATWQTNSTSHQSNLHPQVNPCYHVLAGSDHYKYNLLFTPTHALRWMKRIQDGAYWTSYTDCANYLGSFPVYGNGFSIDIEDLSVYLSCFVCSGCSPFFDGLTFHLPDGIFDVVYTNGTDTFELFGITDFHTIQVEIFENISYSLISVTEVGGCPVPDGFFGPPVDFEAPHNDPGLHSDIWVCPNNGYYALWYFLGGTPDPGGDWSPDLFVDPITGIEYYLSFWGPGTYHYIFKHDGCPPDTASVTVNFVNIDDSILEVGCDQNGTPNDITDDRIVITLTVLGVGFGPQYKVEPFAGDVEPSTGIAGIPQTFLLDPGTATASYMTIRVTSLDPNWCHFTLDVPIPGFCSDPCDYDMITSISGSQDDICLKNCPENPASLFIDIAGGTPPYKADFTLDAPSFPLWVFNGVDVNPSGEISICIDNVPAPVYNAGTGQLILPQALAGSSVTFTLDQIYDKYDCNGGLDNVEHTFYIHPLPAIATTSFMVCHDEALHYDLTELDLLISTAYDVEWYDGDPLQGGDQIFGPNVTNLDNVNQLWAYVADDYCENSIQVPFTILPQPELDSVPPVSICQGSNVVLQSIALNDFGNSMATYTYHGSLPPDSTNQLDPTFYIPADSTTIYVLATTAGGCYDTLPIEIFVEDYPDFLLEAQPCNLIQGTYSILFTSGADSIHASAGVVVNNPTGQDAINGIPNDTNVTIEIFNPSGLCKDTFLIVAPNCNCPQINQPNPSNAAYEICEGEPLPVMSVNIDPGMIANWYDVPSGGLPILQNSLTFQPILPTNAIYYVEALDPTSNCYSIRTPISLQVHPVALLQILDDTQLCENETINLSTLVPGVLNGVGGSGGWFDLVTQQPVSGTITPQNGDTWYYVFSSNPGNCTSSDTMSAVVHPLPDIDLFNILCDDVALTYQVLFTSGADAVTASNGTLIQIPGTDSFSLQDIPFDTNIQLDLQNNATGCVASLMLPAPDCSCPPLLQNNVFQLCSGLSALDLSTFEGPGVLGTWQIVSTPPGPNPGTLIGANFQSLNANPGTYVLRFIRSTILADCVDTAQFQLQLSTSPFADAGANALVCAPDNINLTGLGGGSTVQFNWQTNGDGIIPNPNALNTVYTPTLADITAGSINFTLTATDQNGLCPTASETITITIDGTAYYILSPGTQTYCDTSDILIDLDALISFGTTSGEWFFPDTVNAPITGLSQINPSTLTAGNYTIFYTSTNAVAPCEDDTTAVNLIIENCSCPSVALNTPSQELCSESDVLNLNTLLLTGEPGTWSIVSSPPGTVPALINGGQFVTNKSDEGIYRLRYTLSNPIAGCPPSAEINLEVIATPELAVVSAKCADDLQSWYVVITSTSPTLINSLGTIVSLGNNQYRIENIALNTPLQVSASSGNGLCSAALNIPSVDCECTLSISNLPDEVTLCPHETIVLEPEVNDPKGDVTSFWIVANDSVFQTDLTVGQAGTYEFVTYDELGCREEHTVDVNYYQEMVPSVSWLDIPCPGDHNGEIILQGIVGGSGPYFISINGGNMQPISSFPYIINGLGAGSYDLELTDGFSCTIEFEVQITSASSETLSLGPDQTILVGDSIQILPVLSFVPDSFYWTGDVDQLLDALQLAQWVKPETDQAYELFGIDEKGCIYHDDLKIRVLLESSIYIPTVFSPNGDGVNDFLAPLADPSITEIQYFEVFSRWGELIYSLKNFDPHQGNVGWDGTLRGENMMPGVFVYRLAAVNKKGKILNEYGDVTLIR